MPADVLIVAVVPTHCRVLVTRGAIHQFSSGRRLGRSGSHVLEGEVASVQPEIREAARAAFPSFHWMATGGHENLAVHVSADAEPKVEARINRANPVTCSQPIGFRLCGIAEDPFCPLANGSSTSPISVF